MSTATEIVYCSVIVDTAIDKPLDYAVPLTYSSIIKPGMRVLVPIRGQLRKGTVIAIKESPETTKVQEIKEILSEKPLISEELFSLASWISQYYCAPLRKVLRSILPPSIRSDLKAKTQLFVKSLLTPNELLTILPDLRSKHPSQAHIIDVLLQNTKGMLLSELLEKAKASKSPVDSLLKKKVITSFPIHIDRSLFSDQEHFLTKPKTLSEEQSQALDKIKKTIDENTFATHLLFGVTGSGKTEVYLQAITHAISQNKSALFLVPEISLTSQTLDRLKSRFLEKICILHHKLSDGEKRDAWYEIQKGNVPIVIGARSALFSPLPNLGLIIVDEEHESSYKQSDESPCYHARDVAVMRGKLTNSTVILGSASPSVESYYNALQGKYIFSQLLSRPENAYLPKIHIVDMKKEFAKAKGFTLFSELLLENIKKRLEIGEQTLLFLNRRGYHTSQLCQNCSHVIECPHCDVSLTYHLGEKILACHLCDHRIAPPSICPSCKSDGGLKYKGAGTEMVERALHAIFPEIRTLRLDADTTRHKGSHEMLFKQFRAGKADVLIGTQMIAKGLHFPSVTLVGVLNADSALQIPDFRASEHVFQILIQVSGRAGRSSLPGEVVIQTNLPEQETIQLASQQNYPLFFQKEIEIRSLFDYPPFSRFVKLTFVGEDASLIQKEANVFREALLQRLPSSFELHPLIACGHAKIKDNYRFQFLIKTKKLGGLSSILEEMQKKFFWGKKMRLFIDVDPLSTFF